MNAPMSYCFCSLYFVLYYNIVCADEDMSDPNEALDILCELICKDSRSSRGASDQSPAKQKHSTNLTG